MTVTWTPPVSDGGAPITGYIIQKCDTATGRWVRANRDRVTETSYTVTDLTEGNKYEFRISAENKAGIGKASETSGAKLARPPYGKLVYF